ncbi:GGDEF domain-containing protein, partial [Escherichia coli]|nr:GGDEF domain-containing protein [Escherichia coli]
NDTYGHEVGDAVLSRISTILRECAGEKDVPARFGGDELAIIVNNSNRKLVIAMVDIIQEKIKDLSLPSHKDMYCTVSIGI